MIQESLDFCKSFKVSVYLLSQISMPQNRFITSWKIRNSFLTSLQKVLKKFEQTFKLQTISNILNQMLQLSVLPNASTLWTCFSNKSLTRNCTIKVIAQLIFYVSITTRKARLHEITWWLSGDYYRELFISLLVALNSLLSSQWKIAGKISFQLLLLRVSCGLCFGLNLSYFNPQMVGSRTKHMKVDTFLKLIVGLKITPGDPFYEKIQWQLRRLNISDIFQANACLRRFSYKSYLKAFSLFIFSVYQVAIWVAFKLSIRNVIVSTKSEGKIYTTERYHWDFLFVKKETEFLPSLSLNGSLTLHRFPYFYF